MIGETVRFSRLRKNSPTVHRRGGQKGRECFSKPNQPYFKSDIIPFMQQKSTNISIQNQAVAALATSAAQAIGTAL